MSELEFIRQIAREAGAILLGRDEGRNVAALGKSNAKDLVTEFDRRAENFLVGKIRARFPDDAILGEEGGAHPGSSGRRWLIDPLDGTINFVHRVPFYCVSIALEVNSVLEAGVIEAPALGWSFHAERGAGAFRQTVKHPAGERLSVSDTATLDTSLLATGFPYDSATHPQNNFAEFAALTKMTHGVRRFGSAALDLAMVACGIFDGYWERKLKPWDVAAGALLVAEAGGKVTSVTGGRFFCDEGEAVASNGIIHSALLAAVVDVRPQV